MIFFLWKFYGLYYRVEEQRISIKRDNFCVYYIFFFLKISEISSSTSLSTKYRKVVTLNISSEFDFITIVYYYLNYYD